MKDALVPPSTWLGAKAPAAPKVESNTQNELVHTSWTHPADKQVFHWVVYYQYGSTWAYKILTRGEHSIDLPLHSQDKTGQLVLNKMLVTAVDRLGNESEQVAAQLN